MSATVLDVAAVRDRFSSLRGGFAFLDAPGGSQVPDEVGRAIADALRDASGNLGAPYETGRRVEAIVGRARADAGRFLNCSPDDVVFGTNMTVLDFTLSRTASRDWKEGDRILVSRLDHDGGVAPWLELAADRGFEIDWIDVTADLRLDYDDLERKLDERVRVVATVASSNALGTIVDMKRVSELAHAVGALSWFDAVQYAAHEPVDVQALDCDVFIASAYKFCGPHLGRRFLEGLPQSATVYGEPTMEGRLPTFLLNLDGVPATEIADTLGARGYGVWAHDSWYSLGLREKLPYPEEALRVGLIHYNTTDEVDGFLRELRSFVQ
jgi:selenocysteine lyase/cysteine desulfurase